jgi:hypothetical protein
MLIDAKCFREVLWLLRVDAQELRKKKRSAHRNEEPSNNQKVLPKYE